MKRIMQALILIFAMSIVAKAERSDVDPSLDAIAKRCEAVEFSGKAAPVEKIEDLAYCRGFLMAVLHQYVLQPPWNLFCLPTGFTNDQAAKILIKYAADNPQSLHEDATFHALLAFSAFLCHEEKPEPVKAKTK